MSKYNTEAHTEASIATTRAFLQRTSPLVYIYAPSGTGKTTWIGSTFRHPLYHRVLLIDADQGATTIAEYAYNETLCDLREFELTPDRKATWLSQQLTQAQKAECGAIVIEGFMSVHRDSVSHFAQGIDFAKPEEMMQAHAKAANQTGVLVGQIHAVKQWRRAAKIGVPIIVSLNTREKAVEQGKINSPKYVAPDLSDNLCEKFMTTADACIELRRDNGGTHLLTQQSPENTFRKLRAGVPFRREEAKINAARAIENQINLDLPGMFALWAQADADLRASINNLTTTQY